MGMLVNGSWLNEDDVIVAGAYQRPASPIRADVAGAVDRLITEEPGRFLLIGSLSCPWSHRTLLTRGLKSLQLQVHCAFGPRIQGYALNGGEAWNIPGSGKTSRHLHEVYTLHDPDFTGRVTVPVLWDKSAQRIISNESTDILAILDRVEVPEGPDFTLEPSTLAAEIETANQTIYAGLNNAVYQAGFAETQSAYDTAVTTVFDTLDALEQRLATSRYYFGDVLTATDLRIFPTLIRFDAIYAILFKCCLRRIVDYPNLWGYARDLYRLKGAAETVDFDQMRKASYLADTSDPRPVVAIAPDADWNGPQSRSELGSTKIASRSGQMIVVDPQTLQPIADDT